MASSLVVRLGRTGSLRFHKPSLLALLALDCLFVLSMLVIGLLVLMGVMDAIPGLLDLGRDRGIPEAIGYLKWLLLSAVFFTAYRRRGQIVFAVIGLIFLLILADDSLMLHERIGQMLKAANPSADGSIEVLGELGYWIGIGSLCAAALAVFWFGLDRSTKQSLVPLGLFFAGIVFFGVVVDAAHSFAPSATLISGLLLLLEEAGEMILASLMVSYSIATFGPGADPV